MGKNLSLAGALDRTMIPAVRSRGAKRAWSIVVTIAVLSSVSMFLAPAAEAAPPAVDLEQCRNGGNDSPGDVNDCEELGGSAGWVTGNAGSSNAHYVEGHSIPYRAILTDLPIGSTVVLKMAYDIKHSDKHAIDFLTHYQRLEPHAPFGHPAETVFPTSGVTIDTATTDTEPVDAPSSAGSPVAGQPTTAFNALPAGERVMSSYGATISDFSYVSHGSLTAAQSETVFTVTFTPDSETAVLAWGGHIATSLDWGDGMSAAGISGSPYHMRIKEWTIDGVPKSLGNQDRSLSADAVIPVPALDITKSADKSTVDVGGQVTYTIEVPNTGTGPAEDLVITDDFDDDLVITSASFTGGTNGPDDCAIDTSDNTISCNVGDLAAGDTVTVTVIITTTPDSCGPITNQASYTTSNAGGGSSNVVEVVVECPDVHISKISVTDVDADDDYVYTITGRNDGDAPAEDVVITDDLDDALVVNSATYDVDPDGDPDTSDGTCTVGAGNTITCEVGTLAESDGLANGPDTVQVIIEVTAPPSACRTVQNQAHIDASNEPEADQSDNDSDIVNVNVQCPDVEVHKEASAESVEAGDSITYTLTVHNHGSGTAKNVTVTDDLDDSVSVTSVTPSQGTCDPVGAGNTISCDLGNIAAGGSATVEIVVDTSTASCPGISNQASVSATNEPESAQGNNTSSEVTVGVVCHPDIHIEKTGPAQAHVGDTVTYEMEVTNPGDTPLDDVTVTDPDCSPVVFTGGDTNGDGLLDTDETWTYECDRVIEEADGDPVLNTATATGIPLLGGDTPGDEVSDDDDHTIDILHPDIEIVKTGPATAHEGDTVTYTMTVTNEGDTPLSVDVSDPDCDSAITFTGGDTNGNDLLDLSETWTYECERTLTAADDGDPADNTSTATGTDADGGEDVDTDDHAVDILHPDIEIEKTGPATTHEGETVTYLFTVTNEGDTPLSVDVSDPDCDTAMVFTGGDTNANDLLDTTETWTYTCDRDIEAADGDPVENTGTATGTDSLGGDDVDTDDHVIDVLHPDIMIVKDGPDQAHVGDVIDYTLTVTNEGDTPLHDVSVTDPNCDSGPNFEGGDTNGDDLLDVDETWTYSCSHQVTAEDDDPLLNTATVEGFNGLEEPVTDDDDHIVDILHPDIEIEKTGPAVAHVGDTITYTFTVTNDGDTPLTVELDDPICDEGTLELLSGDANDNDLLDVTETWTYQCTHEVTGEDEDPLPNTATATGTDEIGGEDVDTDDHVVDILHPDIEVEKTGLVTETGLPGLGHIGDTVVYTLTVTNDGDTALAVDLEDTLCDTISFTGGDTNDNDLLDLEEIWVYTCSHVIMTEDADPLPNVATATGTDEAGGQDVDSDDHSVDVIHPAITIDKVATPAAGAPGQEVTFSYTVTNTGDVTLFDVSVDDDKLGHIGDIAVLLPGPENAVTLTIDSVFPESAAGGALTNVGTAVGADETGREVSDDDTVTVGLVLSEPPDEPKVLGKKLAKTGTAGFGLFTATGVSFVAAGLLLLVASRLRDRVVVIWPSDAARLVIRQAHRSAGRLKSRWSRRAPPSRAGPP